VLCAWFALGGGSLVASHAWAVCGARTTRRCLKPLQVSCPFSPSARFSRVCVVCVSCSMKRGRGGGERVLYLCSRGGGASLRSSIHMCSRAWGNTWCQHCIHQISERWVLRLLCGVELCVEWWPVLWYVTQRTLVCVCVCVCVWTRCPTIHPDPWGFAFILRCQLLERRW